MSYRLIYPDSYLKRAKKFLKKHPGIRSQYQKTLGLSQQRVAERVAHGGHDIALEVIHRRFPRSLSGLFQTYAGLVSRASCFMNHQEWPVLVIE